MSKAKLIAVDDDRNFLRVLVHQLRSLDYEVVGTQSAREALKVAAAYSPDLAITDLRMPEMDGLDLLEQMLSRWPTLPVILLTAHGTIQKAVEATRKGAYHFLTKPFEIAELVGTIDNALTMTRLVRENERLAQLAEKEFKFEGISGFSAKFQRVLDQASQLSRFDTTVLILGETGTGKELLARAIHCNSARKAGPFMTVNCGAIPADLLESELFGYREGAFTGAVGNRQGKFEAAAQGTLFLDEIGELSLNVQVKLLRALQEKEIDILGDTLAHKVDIRILAATNRDLESMVQANEFREDLYYRLSVAPVRIPALRERMEDIPILARHFLEVSQKRYSKSVLVDPEVLETFAGYSWPGNIRELENIIERLVVFAKNGRIRKRDLPAEIRHRNVKALGDVILHVPEKGFSLKALERDALKTALEMNDWNQTHAARYLSISRNALIYRMHKFGLSPARRTSGRNRTKETH